MQAKYSRLSFGEREEISRGLASGLSFRPIAAAIGRSPSTVSREVARLRRRKRGYRAGPAQRAADRAASSRRSGMRKLSPGSRLLGEVTAKLHLKWSPEQVARWLESRYPGDMTMRASRETIYGYVYALPRGELRRELVSALRQERKYRRPKARRKGTPAETRGRISGMLSIEERPAEAADRTVPGHWEGDLILGAHRRTALGTLVERSTRYTILVPLGGRKDAASVRKAYARAMRSLPKELARSLTYDQGKEMSEHARFTVDTGVKVYFAHPSSPWERGTNENTNGLVRQFFPKGTDFSKVSRAEVKRAQRLLNGRPRKTLGWSTPSESFNELLR